MPAMEAPTTSVRAALMWMPPASRAVTTARFGNAGFNSVRGPGVNNLNASLFRKFSFRDRFAVEFRAEAFNATNTPHFSNPSNNSISNVTFNPDHSVANLKRFRRAQLDQLQRPGRNRSALLPARFQGVVLTHGIAALTGGRDQALGEDSMDRREFLQITSGAAVQAHLPRAKRQPRAAALKLWYASPASNWNEALPIGNGRLGGMIFGGIDKDEVQVNDDTLYSEEPHTGRSSSRRHKAVPGSRASFSGAVIYSEAADIITRHWTGRSWPCYQPLATLVLSHSDGAPGAFTKYRRELDLANAVSTTEYVRDGVSFTREYFASAADDAIVVRIKSSRPEQISCDVCLVTPHPEAALKSVGDHGHFAARTGPRYGSPAFRWNGLSIATSNGSIPRSGRRTAVESPMQTP